MKLTNFTDYSLRVLIYLASLKENRLVNIKEIADVYQISKNHLMKVVFELGKLGYIETIRGRNGGVKLALDPKNISVGEVVKKTEDDFDMVECFDPSTNNCVISPACKLKNVIHEALNAYLQVLLGYSIADLVENRIDLQLLFEK